MILTEYLPNAGRRPQISERVRKIPHNWVGQKNNEEKKENRIEMEPASLKGSCERGKVPALGEVPSPAGRSATTEEEIWSLGGEATGLWQPEQRETCTDSQCHCPALPSMRGTFAGAGSGWVLSLGFRDQTWGENWGWLHGNSLKLAGVWCDHN